MSWRGWGLDRGSSSRLAVKATDEENITPDSETGGDDCELWLDPAAETRQAGLAAGRVTQMHGNVCRSSN